MSNQIIDGFAFTPATGRLSSDRWIERGMSRRLSWSRCLIFLQLGNLREAAEYFTQSVSLFLLDFETTQGVANRLISSSSSNVCLHCSVPTWSCPSDTCECNILGYFLLKPKEYRSWPSRPSRITFAIATIHPHIARVSSFMRSTFLTFQMSNNKVLNSVDCSFLPT